MEKTKNQNKIKAVHFEGDFKIYSYKGEFLAKENASLSEVRRSVLEFGSTTGQVLTEEEVAQATWAMLYKPSEAFASLEEAKTYISGILSARKAFKDARNEALQGEKFAVNQKIIHPTHGEGTIKTLLVGGDTAIVVFPTAGMKIVDLTEV